MSITDKLREAFNECTVMAGVENDFECVYITKAAAMLCLDEIDAEHEKELAEQYASLTVDMEPMTDENMAKHGWVRLPKDADGVLWNDGVGRTNDEVEMLQNEIYDYEKMYSHICDQLARVKGYLAEAHERNAKLRKLCKMFAEYVSQDRCEGCVCKSRCNAGEIDECWMLAEIREIASELGFEVDG